MVEDAEDSAIPEDPAGLADRGDLAGSGDLVGSGELEDLGADEPRGTLRRCVLTRASAERARMLRFVAGPGGAIVPDLAARLPGRGIWLSARGDVLDHPRLRGAFARAARAPVSVPADLRRLVADGLARRVAERLGLARRAGAAVCGFERSREWLRAGRAGLVIAAREGSQAELARLLSGSGRPGAGTPGTGKPGAGQVRVARPLDAAGLGAVFGRDHVVHVAVAHGSFAEALLIETDRLAGVLGEPQAEQAG